jgi:hypothetical protein
MPSAGFEPATPATKRPQTYALDSAAAEAGFTYKICLEIPDQGPQLSEISSESRPTQDVFGRDCVSELK